MLRHLLSLSDDPPSYDATDALAVAMCHHLQISSVVTSTLKGLKGWDDFIKKNPGRVTL